MQSNTSGGARLRRAADRQQHHQRHGDIGGAASKIRPWHLGQWPRPLDDITVSNNDFYNLTGATRLTNLMRALRNHLALSATTTVAYAGNTVDGANISFQWIAGSDFSGNQPVVVSGNAFTSRRTGLLIQSGSKATLSNTLTNSGA